MEPSELFEALRRPFEPSDLEWRVMYSTENDRGPFILVAPYVQRPALINRLNQVCGIGGWQTDTRASPGVHVPGFKRGNQTIDPTFYAHVMVGVGIRVKSPDPLLQLRESALEVLEPAYEWIWRWDGAGALQGEGRYFTSASAGKGDFSSGFKRACEQFGIATYLREVPSMRAIVNSNGRYKTKIGNTEHRWDPPGLEGEPAYPGEIPGFGLEEGAEPSSSNGNGGGIRPSSSPPAQTSAPKPKSEKEEKASAAAQLKDAKERVRSFMKENGYRIYHLDALVATHPDLKMRYSSAEELGRTGSLEDWLVITAVCDKMKGGRWENATEVLAKEFPTGPERLQVLDGILDRVKLEPREVIEVATAKRIGWNDAIEYWIEELGKR